MKSSVATLYTTMCRFAFKASLTPVVFSACVLQKGYGKEDFLDI